jgi:SAM-dependent methyltransferase
VTDQNDRLRESYDRLAAEYTRHVADELAGKPFDRELLDRFAALTRGNGPVLDLGCGPGHVAAYLHARGVAVTGIDLSGQMIAEARRLNPEIPFRQGSMTRLSERSALAGIVAFYSIIHVERAVQPAMFASWRDALKPEGWLLVSFHVGTEVRRPDELWGVPIEIDFLFFTPEEVERRLTEAGFAIVERHDRDAYPGVEADTRRCYLLAQRPVVDPISR